MMIPESNEDETALTRSIRIVVVGLAAIFLTYHFLAECERIADFDALSADMAAWDQSMWNTLHGRFMQNGAEGNLFAVNFNPILLLLLPFYAVHPGPHVLVLIAHLCIAAGSILLFGLALSESGDSIAAGLVTLAYLCHPAVHGMAQSSFHAVVMAVPLVFFLVSAIRRGRIARSLIWTAVLLIVKQDMAFVVVPLGIWALFSGRKAVGAAMSVIGVVYFVVVIYLLIPLFGGEDPMAYYLIRFPDTFGGGLGSALAYAVFHPIDFLGLMASHAHAGDVDTRLLWTAVFGLGAPGLLLVMLPTLSIHLSANFFLHHTVVSHYFAPVVPILFSAIAIGLGRLGNRRRMARCIVGGLAAFSFLATFVVGDVMWQRRGAGSDLMTAVPLDAEQKAFLQQLRGLLPPQASLVASRNLAFFFAHREKLYFPIYDAGVLEGGACDFALIDSRMPLLIRPEDAEGFQRILDRDYRLVRNAGGILLFSSRRTPAPDG